MIGGIFKLPKVKVSKPINSNIVGYSMLIPGSILILLVSIYPLLNGIYLSLFNYNILSDDIKYFVGFKNFFEIITTDKQFYSALLFSFIYSFLVVIVSYICGLVCALLLDSEIRFRNIFRALILLPWLIPGVVMANIFIWMLNDYGQINNFLINIHLIDEPILFLAKPILAKFTVISVSIWKSIPFVFIVLLAGLQSIPPELYEAASIDGAGFFRKLFSIQLPLLRPVSFISTTLLFIWTFNNFEYIWLLTKGGPSYNTFVLPILSYYVAFFRGHLGYASAISVILLILLLIFVLIYSKIQRMKLFF